MAIDDLTSYRALVVTFCEFLTVAVHTILYERQVYPLTSFLSARKYNLAVRQNRHPKVCEWINDAVHSVEYQLLKCAVDRVAVVIFSKSNTALERFVFDVSPFPLVPEKDVDLPLLHQGQDEPQGLPTVDMDEQFRAVLIRLQNSTAKLKPIPQGCTFTLAIDLKGYDNAPLSHPQAWIPVVPQDDTPESSASSAKAATVKPIRAMNAGDLAFDSWVEESAAKAFKEISSQSDTSG